MNPTDGPPEMGGVASAAPAVLTKQPAKAAVLLFAATVFWGTSFILTKALGDLQHSADPRASTWLIASLSLLFRSGGAALLVGLWNLRTMPKVSKLEFGQGLGLGLFGGVGILLQTDAVMHTQASTCAFLTQCYCIFIPLYLALRNRAFPKLPLALACVLAVAGMAALANIDWRSFRVGRGELETLAASLFFTGQILWLERPIYAANNSNRMSVVMYGVTALVLLPAAAVSSDSLRQCVALYSQPAALVIALLLLVACTIAAYGVMNRWQPHVPATEAGLIYCCEPVFTSLFALWLPGLISRWAGLHYANERVTTQLLLGGGLITAANLLAILRKKA